MSTNKRRVWLEAARKNWFCYLALLPAGLFIMAIIGYPLINAFYLSLFHKELLKPWKGTEFVGLANYIHLLLSPKFRATIVRTILWTASSVGLKVLLGIAGALVLRGELKGKKTFRALIMPAWAVPLSISAIVWGWMYNGQFGLINGILLGLGILDKPFEFLAFPATAFIGALINDVWKGVPFMILVFLAGLEAIPQDLYEAAEVDGAPAFQRFIYITLPQWKNTLLIGTILSTVWTFNSFDIIWVLTGGGPLNATTTLVISAYRKAFGSFQMGKASAVSVIIFIILMAIAYLYSRNIKLEEK